MELTADEYRFEQCDGDTLWVILSARGMGPGRFSFFRRGCRLPGSKLFVRTPREDFYQGMFEPLIERIAALNFERVIYVGFSAGAFAALVLGMRVPNTCRVIALGPPIRLNVPLTIAHRTVVAPLGRQERFDPRYADLAAEIAATSARIDIVLGINFLMEGPALRDAQAIRNEQVVPHFVRANHDVGYTLSEEGLLEPALLAAHAGADIVLPDRLTAAAAEVELAIVAYDLAHRLETERRAIELPDIDDAACLNPLWWNIKSRIRFRQGDVPGAVGDIARAIALGPQQAINYVYAGHYWKAMRQYEFAAAAYEKAAAANKDGWRGFAGLADIGIRLRDRPAAEKALGVAMLRGAPLHAVTPLRTRLERL